MMDEASFEEALQKVKIPMLPLDQKWHRLFAISGKPEEVKDKEAALNELLEKQGTLNQSVKEYKKLKNNLMQGIVQNMEGDKEAQKKLDDNKRMIEELNRKIEEAEDELLELPKEIDTLNRELMMETMRHCYPLLKKNNEEMQEIADWITQFRVELKKQIIRKQNREINNKEIYAYMHDVFGAQVIDLFDVQYDPENEVTEKEKFDKDVRELSQESKKVIKEEG